MEEMRLISATEAARRVGVTKAAIACWIKKGRLSAYRVGNAYAINVEDLKQADELSKQHRNRQYYLAK